MQVQDLIKQNIKYLRVSIPCDNGFELSELPDHLEHSSHYHCKEQEFCFTIDLQTHKVMSWDASEETHIFLKLVDTGSYYLLDGDFTVIKHIEGGYVPYILDFDGKSYGDYLKLDIATDGTVTNWKDVDLHDLNDGWIDSRAQF